MVYSKRKEFASKNLKLFPFRVDPLKKGFKMQKSIYEVKKVVSLLQNGGKLNLPSVSSPLNARRYIYQVNL